MDAERLQEIERWANALTIAVSEREDVRALIAEVRRLRQDRSHWMRHIADIADQRDTALAERDAAVMASESQRKRADHEYARADKLGKERDAARAERDALFNSARALLNDEPQANGEYIHAVTCSADRKKPIGCGGCSCQLGRRIKLLASALTEARRVLREVEWGSCEYPPVCPMCALAQHEGHSVYCALAAVLAQEEPS